jgi:RNA polymerase sigma-70 factor (ECF subfamily)
MVPPVVPLDSAQQEQEGALLHRALMQLSEERREVLILARFQELKYAEIARVVGCELNTVKTRIHRALQDLREAFRELERGVQKNARSAAPDVFSGRAGQ